MPNNICHIEIPTVDFNVSTGFYGEVFGWKIEYIPENDYAVFDTGESPGGGFPKVDKITSGGILIYIMVEDIGRMLKKIEKAGGKIITPRTEIPETGWFAIFSDPEGNFLGLFQAGK
ncbi:hypothetical protein DRQ09_03125 [candidate division KSB1 bacterium]|nr:MAG: hypothetical protein DRQ09_03125 [candidate division KSB1 bacterium]